MRMAARIVELGRDIELDVDDRGNPLCPTCRKAMDTDSDCLLFCFDMQCEFDGSVWIGSPGKSLPMH